MKPNMNIQTKKHRTPSRPASGPVTGRRQPRGPQARPSSSPQRSPRSLLILVLGALLLAGGTWALFEFVIWNTVPAALVGKWVVTVGPQEGATFDFYRGGAMVGVVNVGGKEAVVNARIRVEDNKIFSTTQSPTTGRNDTRVLLIRRLSLTDLVIEDEQSGVLKLERAQ